MTLYFKISANFLEDPNKVSFAKVKKKGAGVASTNALP